jgi:hypothetical protein
MRTGDDERFRTSAPRTAVTLQGALPTDPSDGRGIVRGEHHSIAAKAGDFSPGARDGSGMTFGRSAADQTKPHVLETHAFGSTPPDPSGMPAHDVIQ